MIYFGIGQFIAGTLLFISGCTFREDHPVLAFIDILLGCYLIWSSVERDDPPSNNRFAYRG